MDDFYSREAICKIGASLYARGFVHASAGNISIKLQDGSFLITPTDACLGSLVSQDLAHVSATGEQLSGLRASKTIILHRSIYETEPHATCVIHAHCTHLVSLTLQGVWQESAIIPPITPYFVMKVGKIPWISYHRPGDPKVATQVKKIIRQSIKTNKPIRGVMLDRLGPVIWHRSPFLASAVLEELEETAKLWLLSHRQVEPLNEHQMEELRVHFGAIW